MKIVVSLDEELLAKAQQVSGLEGQPEVIQAALRALITGKVHASFANLVAAHRMQQRHRAGAQ